MIKINEIESKIQNRSNYDSIEPMVTRKASVLIPLVETQDGLEILFEKRSSDIAQGGEICFPGGIIDVGETPEETSIREIKEELLLSDNQIEFLGPLHVMGTEYGTRIYSNLGVLKDYENSFSRDEVESVFTIPLKWFKENEPEIYDVRLIRDKDDYLPYDIIPGGKAYPWKSLNSKLYFYRSEPEIIWGLTAKLLFYFISMVYK